MADDAARPQPCAPCRATGTVVSHLDGSPHDVPCPWCDGTGTTPPGHDAQAGSAAEARRPS